MRWRAPETVSRATRRTDARTAPCWRSASDGPSASRANETRARIDDSAYGTAAAAHTIAYPWKLAESVVLTSTAAMPRPSEYTMEPTVVATELAVTSMRSSTTCGVAAERP